MSLNEEITKIQSMLDTAKTELTAFEKGNKSSAARARKSLQSIKTASHSTRKSIMERSKALPKKTRTPKVSATAVAVETGNVAEDPPEPLDESVTEPPILKKPRKPRVKKTVLKTA